MDRRRGHIRLGLHVLLWGTLLVYPSKAQAESVLAIENITVQPGGPRQGDAGLAFFNIEGEDNGGFASYGAVRFDVQDIRQSFDGMFGADLWTVDTVELVLTQFNASFTKDGLVDVWFIGEDELDLSQFSTLVYPFDPEEFGDAAPILDYEFVEVADGTEEVYTLFGNNISTEGALALGEDLMSDDLVTLMLVDGDPIVAATYAGFTNETFPGPTLNISAVPIEQAPRELLAGDADQDLDFDQLDLVQVQIGGKYLSGAAATWGEGDWNGAPGGTPGDPPAGDGLFNQLDIVAAQQAAVYLTGPYAAVTATLEPAALTQVPEPSAAGLLWVGVIVGLWLRRTAPLLGMAK